MRAHTHTCDVRSHVCVRNLFLKVCGMCVRAARFGRAMCDHTFAHFFELNCQKNATFSLKNCSGTSYPVLEHPFLLFNSKNVVKFPEKIEKLLKNVE